MAERQVVVVGAGALGGWTALECLRGGAQVTLVDAWEPGHSRASSGGDTRVIRHGYGPEGIYVGLVQRALAAWRRAPEDLGEALLDETGVLWLVQEDEAFEVESMDQMGRAGVPVERLERGELARRWPQVNLSGVRWALHEPHAGALSARQACRAVARAFQAGGGRLVRGHALPIDPASGPITSLRLSDGSTLRADRFVLAPGPWAAALLPKTLAPLLSVTRQEVFTFGTPPGDTAHHARALPVWADHSEHFWYGIPGNRDRGFKLGRDTLGPVVDPTTMERTPGPDELAAVRAYLALRFPGMAGAPLLESRVCQYTNTPDRQPILSPLPGSPQVALAAGGSGHAFKLGPALGADLAAWALRDAPLDPFFTVDRFA